MSKATPDITNRGRPDQAGAPVLVRFQPEALKRLDAWIAQQEGDALTRPQAIRRLLDMLLA
jgi:hypothetical protein